MSRRVPRNQPPTGGELEEEELLQALVEMLILPKEDHPQDIF